METIQRMKDKKNEQSGFTLIELLIVIVILGILAAIVVFAVGGISDRGTKSACKSDYKSVEVAQEAKFAKDKVYAANAGVLVTEKFLRQAPPIAGSTPYGIDTDNTGAVTANPAACAIT